MRCDNCSETDDTEYFNVKWAFYNGQEVFEQTLCSVCTDEIWDAFNLRTLKIEAIIEEALEKKKEAEDDEGA